MIFAILFTLAALLALLLVGRGLSEVFELLEGTFVPELLKILVVGGVVFLAIYGAVELWIRRQER